MRFLNHSLAQEIVNRTTNIIHRNINVMNEKGDLLETLSVYVEENGDVNKAAGRLFIHRNTLRYRLERISELTNKDPRKLSDLVELYVAILQYKIQ